MRRITLWSIIFTIVGTVVPSWAAPGDLDTTFSGDGKVITNYVSGGDGYDVAQDVAVAPNGRLVAVGVAGGYAHASVAVTRYNANGSLDTTFSGDGKLRSSAGTQANAVAVQSNGKIVLVALRSPDVECGGILIERLNSNGTLDPTFSGDGKATIAYSSLDACGFDVALQADGKILIGGSTSTDPMAPDGAVFRLTASGGLDTTFSGNGRMDIPAADYIESVRRLSNGKIVAGGVGSTGLFVARLTPNGAYDTTFSNDGRAALNFGALHFGGAMAVQSNGRIVVAGSVCPSSSCASRQIAVGRMTTAGAADPTFSGNGKVTFGFGGTGNGASDVAIASTGRIVVAGVGGTALSFAVARLTAGGNLDSTFSGDGRHLIPFGPVGGHEGALALAIQGNDRIVVAGGDQTNTDTRWALARLMG